MPPKVPRATDWRPLTFDDLLKEAGKLDGKALWTAVCQTLPYFNDLLPDDQRFVIDRIAKALLWASLRIESHRTRPTLPTMRKNIGDLLAAIEATRSALAAVDIISQYRLTISAGDYQNTDKETVVERGLENWARFGQALRDAAGWTASALQDIPHEKEKKGPPFGLDGLIIELADIFETTYVPKEELRPPAIVNTPESQAEWEKFVARMEAQEPSREITRSTNIGGFVEFATRVVQLGPALRGISIDQVVHAMRRCGLGPSDGSPA